MYKLDKFLANAICMAAHPARITNNRFVAVMARRESTETSYVFVLRIFLYSRSCKRMRFYSHVFYGVLSVVALYFHETKVISSESLFLICSFLVVVISIFEITSTEKKWKVLGKLLFELKRNYRLHSRPVLSSLLATLVFIFGLSVVYKQQMGPDIVILSWLGLNFYYGVLYATLRLMKIRVMENGIVHHNGILNWNDIKYYEWFDTPRSKKKSYSKLRLTNKRGTLFDEVFLEIEDLEKPIMVEILNAKIIRGEYNR